MTSKEPEFALRQDKKKMLNFHGGGLGWGQQRVTKASLKGILSSQKSLTVMLPNNHSMLPPFSW